MSLATPEKIRILQRKLYCKAKAQPAFRFYGLYDKICRDDLLRHAYGLARANAGASGVDGMSFEQIEAQGLEAWLAGVREELVSKTYRPDPVRRVTIPKPDGGERALGIPTVRDRVVQNRRKARAGADLRGRLRGQCLRLSPCTWGGGCGQGSAPADLPGLHRCG
ncbi:hypothetical protein [Microvirga ossetica]|uniref:hypothetical protein n=1 Tax=Microvirga ossetica TaxID=1882682 RepID=UPI001F43A140|nr:hypothetical protein [Microvirga ossetica]